MDKRTTGYPSIDQTHKRTESFWERHPLIPPVSIYQAFCLLSRAWRTDVAVMCEEASWTFHELLEEAKALSKAFIALGIRRGEIISICMPNLYQGIAAFFAANRIGAVVTFFSEKTTGKEIRNYLTRFHSPLLLNYTEDGTCDESLIQETGVRHVITLDRDGALRHLSGEATNPPDKNTVFLRYQDLYHIAEEVKTCVEPCFGGDRAALILFTSGTTGEPKAVVLTNQNILAAATYLKNSSHISNTRGEKSLVCVPFMYPYGFSTSALMSLLCGRTAILAPNLTIDTISGYLAQGPNIIFGNPALVELIMRGTPHDQDLSSVTTYISGGDYLTSALEAEGKKFFEAHGSRVVMCNGCGNAETTSCGTNPMGVELRPGTVGKVLTGSDGIIIDPDSHAELKYRQEGMLCISGRHVFKEYYGEPELTKQVKLTYKGKTYFMTGMFGFLDEDGYFTITGRMARFYIMSTLNKIYCDRVQTAICAIQGVAACAVVKKPDAALIYVGKAYLVLEAGLPPNAETVGYIKAKCREPILLPGKRELIHLKPYEIPTDFEFVESLPRTKADKIDYKILEERASH